MSVYKIYSFILMLLSTFVQAQIEEETPPPFHIKTIQFSQNGISVAPIFQLGSSFRFSFDDLYANEADYYYMLVHYNYDGTPSGLVKNEYINGNDFQRIRNFTNSVNTLQTYTHYELSFPNEQVQLIKSGHYLLLIMNSQQEVVFSRKMILYENEVAVAAQVKRVRDINHITEKQNIEIAINFGEQQYANPAQYTQIRILKNEQWQQSVFNIKPQFTVGNQLIYKHKDGMQFWAGNEFLYFDTKNIRGAGNNIAKIRADNIYQATLYTHSPQRKNPYTYNPDNNGQFVVRSVQTVTDDASEADYLWVHFSVAAMPIKDKKMYVVGQFNNYILSEENELIYNKETQLYEKDLLIKQGFVGYEFWLTDKANKVDFENHLDGNHYQTENNYTVLVYYRLPTERYDRIIGRGTTNSLLITN